jgi:putative SOS response-associated peptidase YedK
MCGRYTLYDTKDLGSRFNLATAQFVSKDNYNVAPRQTLPIIFQDPEQGRVARDMQWGFIPVWSKDPKGLRPINTKSETAFDSRMWMSAVAHHRCLVPSRGFYEWMHLDNGHKVPYFIHPSDQALFAFAGIYSVWHDVEDHPLYTFSIMTTRPNRDMQLIHDRMPVILAPAHEARWLEPAYSEREQLADLLVPYEDGKLVIYKVSEAVNSIRNNDRHLVEAVAE